MKQSIWLASSAKEIADRNLVKNANYHEKADVQLWMRETLNASQLKTDYASHQSVSILREKDA